MAWLSCFFKKIGHVYVRCRLCSLPCVRPINLCVVHRNGVASSGFDLQVLKLFKKLQFEERLAAAGLVGSRAAPHDDEEDSGEDVLGWDVNDDLPFASPALLAFLEGFPASSGFDGVEEEDREVVLQRCERLYHAQFRRAEASVKKKESQRESVASTTTTTLPSSSSSSSVQVKKKSVPLVSSSSSKKRVREKSIRGSFGEDDVVSEKWMRQCQQGVSDAASAMSCKAMLTHSMTMMPSTTTPVKTTTTGEKTKGSSSLSVANTSSSSTSTTGGGGGQEKTKGGVVCGEPCIPNSPYCWAHAMSDTKQSLFQHCIKCGNPVVTSASASNTALCPVHRT